jgi:hypothetical protein
VASRQGDDNWTDDAARQGRQGGEREEGEEMCEEKLEFGYVGPLWVVIVLVSTVVIYLLEDRWIGFPNQLGLAFDRMGMGLPSFCKYI